MLTWERRANPARWTRGHLRHLAVHFFAITKLYLSNPKPSTLSRLDLRFLRQSSESSSSQDAVNETSPDFSSLSESNCAKRTAIFRFCYGRWGQFSVEAKHNRAASHRPILWLVMWQLLNDSIRLKMRRKIPFIFVQCGNIACSMPFWHSSETTHVWCAHAHSTESNWIMGNLFIA